MYHYSEKEMQELREFWKGFIVGFCFAAGAAILAVLVVRG